MPRSQTPENKLAGKGMGRRAEPSLSATCLRSVVILNYSPLSVYLHPAESQRANHSRQCWKRMRFFLSEPTRPPRPPHTVVADSGHFEHTGCRQRRTIVATRSLRCRPYFATTGRRTSVTGLVGLAFRPTERLMGTRSNLKTETKMVVGFCGEIT